MLLRFPRSRIPILVPGGHGRDLHLGGRSRRTARDVWAGRDESRVFDSFGDLHGQEGFCGLQCLRSAKGWFPSWLRLWAGDSALVPDRSPPPGPSLSGTAWPPQLPGHPWSSGSSAALLHTCRRQRQSHGLSGRATRLLPGEGRGRQYRRCEGGTTANLAAMLPPPPPRVQGLVTNRDYGSLWASVPPGCVHESCKHSCVRRSFRKPTTAFSLAAY